MRAFDQPACFPIRPAMPGAVFINDCSNHYRLKRLRPEQVIRLLRLQYDGTKMIIALQHGTFAINLEAGAIDQFGDELELIL
jgi:hypothetical protein